MCELLGISEERDPLGKLTAFIQTNTSTTSFSNIKESEKKKIWNSLVNFIGHSSPGVEVAALEACRLLSRDRVGLDDCIETSYIDTFVDQFSSQDANVELEAKKVMSNLIHQSPIVRAYCTRNEFLPKIFSALKTHKNWNESERFDLKLIFLITALCQEQRRIANSQHRALAIFNANLRRCSETETLREREVNYICEALKVLFNLSLDNADEDGQEMAEICQTLSRIIQKDYENESGRTAVTSNIVNLLTNLDGKPELTVHIFPDDSTKNLSAVLDFLLLKLENVAVSSSLKEEIAPCLSVLWSISKMHRNARKYLKSVVLPPLTAKDIQVKPEKGKGARSKLVSLLTSPDPEIATMTAEFLFVLCKHNVGRLVKHSGYGNAAGLLARRGLLAGGRAEGNFSSDEESDTEDYQKEAHKVNPITGCIEEERKNPLEGMSDEQKEYEAMKLVNMMDDLMKSGLIAPATVGEDGRPQPVSHILELMEGRQGPQADLADADD